LPLNGVLFLKKGVTRFLGGNLVVVGARLEVPEGNRYTRGWEAQDLGREGNGILLMWERKLGVFGGLKR